MDRNETVRRLGIAVAFFGLGMLALQWYQFAYPYTCGQLMDQRTVYLDRLTAAEQTHRATGSASAKQNVVENFDKIIANAYTTAVNCPDEANAAKKAAEDLTKLRNDWAAHKD